MTSGKGQKLIKKAKQVLSARPVTRVQKGTLRRALLSHLKKDTGRKDIRIASATEIASKSMDSIPMEERAGFPLVLTPGGVHPRDWRTHKGVKITVDFSRCAWLPDDWGQGVKQTQPTARSTGTGGGILTTFVAPDGKSFFHKPVAEEYAGHPFTIAGGWNGQVRLAKLQAKQQLQLAHAEGENGGLSRDASLFALLSPAERKCVPAKEDLYVCIISARRATKLEGVRDIFMVQSQFEEAGVRPTWYVDEGSLQDYKALGLSAVVGGKLTPARNKALHDARTRGKVCVQASDDIAAWEYRAGANAKERTDDAMNAAHAAARRLIVSPVAAARFIIAKMRGAAEPRPKLGGVYMLGSCARTFCGDAFARQHFILGDFFVVEPDSSVNFDASMSLKEDYDFTCSHIAKYGSVMRCNRMTLSVKHYSNSGGACSNRDTKGQEEQRNIAILHRKWPGAFRSNPKRHNEVILQWRASSVGDEEDEVDPPAKKSAPAALKLVKKTNTKQEMSLKGIPPDALVFQTKKKATASHIRERCAKVVGKTVKEALAAGILRLQDLQYDLKSGYLCLKHGVVNCC